MPRPIFVLLLAPLLPLLWAGTGAAATSLRRHEGAVIDPNPPEAPNGADAPSDEREARDENARRTLAMCPTFECVPSIHFATLDQATAANGGAEANFYGALEAGPLLCYREDPTVLQLSGVEACNDRISSVQFELRWRGVKLRDSAETVPPYTVFGDSAATGGFASRVLQEGGYELSVLVSSGLCRFWSGTFAFDVVPCTSAPTQAPTAPPTSAASDSESDVPSLSPTTAESTVPPPPVGPPRAL